MAKNNANTNCPQCKSAVREVGIYSEGGCRKWYHPTCAGVEPDEYEKLGQSTAKWRCESCLKTGVAGASENTSTRGRTQTARKNPTEKAQNLILSTPPAAEVENDDENRQQLQDASVSTCTASTSGEGGGAGGSRSVARERAITLTLDRLEGK